MEAVGNNVIKFVGGDSYAKFWIKYTAQSSGKYWKYVQWALNPNVYLQKLLLSYDYITKEIPIVLRHLFFLSTYCYRCCKNVARMLSPSYILTKAVNFNFWLEFFSSHIFCTVEQIWCRRIIFKNSNLFSLQTPLQRFHFIPDIYCPHFCIFFLNLWKFKQSKEKWLKWYKCTYYINVP